MAQSVSNWAVTV